MEQPFKLRKPPDECKWCSGRLAESADTLMRASKREKEWRRDGPDSSPLPRWGWEEYPPHTVAPGGDIAEQG
jgi:hypothetical protein